MVKTRIAPSPTGPNLHIGNFRTALYSYFWAKKNNGEFILRVEDTDRKRYVAGSVTGFFELFDLYNIHIDKKPSKIDLDNIDNYVLPPWDWYLDNSYRNINESDFENKYIQTQRLPLYLKYVFKLLDNGYAYLCFLTEDEAKELKENSPKSQPFRSPHKNLTENERIENIKLGKKYVVRLDVQNFIEKNLTGNVLDYEDLVLGKMKFDLNSVDDQVLIKSNGIPTYHLGVVVDDYLMNITHPIRGYSWLPSTPKQIVIYKALGLQMPPFAHVTDILDPSGHGKLSKRRGAVFASDFIVNGFLPQAVINFITLLGWTPKIERKFGEKEREIFSLDELISLFEISGLSNANAIFDRNKLIWFNKEYIKMLSEEELSSTFINWVKKFHLDKDFSEEIISDKLLSKKLTLLKERAENLMDIYKQLKIFYKVPENINWEIEQVSHFSSKIKEMAIAILKYLESLSENPLEWDNKVWADALKKVSADFGYKPGDSFMILRIAITGEPFSPPLFEVTQLLGKEETVKRLKLCLQ